MLSETNILVAPENWRVEDEISFRGRAYFQGWTVSFREGNFQETFLLGVDINCGVFCFAIPTQEAVRIVHLHALGDHSDEPVSFSMEDFFHLGLTGNQTDGHDASFKHGFDMFFCGTNTHFL